MANEKITGILESSKIWQMFSAGLVGVIIASVLGVNQLTERSISDQRTITEMKAKIDNLVLAVSALQVELAKQGERIDNLRNYNKPQK